MYFNIMRYRNGKFGVSATEFTKQGKSINKGFEIEDMKAKFGKRCIEYRIDDKEGTVHIWTFRMVTAITAAIEELNFPSNDNEEPEG
jgi:hypothetical protein